MQKDQKWLLTIGSGVPYTLAGVGPVDLMKAVCREAGVKFLTAPCTGEWYANSDGAWIKTTDDDWHGATDIEALVSPSAIDLNHNPIDDPTNWIGGVM